MATVSGVGIAGGHVGNEGVVFAATNGVEVRGDSSKAHHVVVDLVFSTFGHAVSGVGVAVGISGETTDVVVSTAESLASSTALFGSSVGGSMPVGWRADEGLVSSDVGTTSSKGSSAFNRVTRSNLSSEGDQLTRHRNVGSNISNAFITGGITMIFAQVSTSEGKGGERIE